MMTILFYILGFILLAATLMCITRRNPVHAVIYLVAGFFALALLFYLLGAPLVAAWEVIVYAGAIMVLFLFVIMMLEVNVEAVKRGLTRYAPLAIAIALIMVIELVQLIWLRSRDVQISSSFAPNPEGYDNTKALGAVLYTEHVYAFEIAAVILLLAIVAAITLTMRKRPGLKVQDIGKQVAVRAKDRIRIVKMDAEKKQ